MAVNLAPIVLPVRSVDCRGPDSMAVVVVTALLAAKVEAARLLSFPNGSGGAVGAYEKRDARPR